MLDDKTLKRLMIISFIGILIVLSLVILWPILTSIVTGLILAFIFYPLYLRILWLVKEKNISALIMVLIIIFIIFVPLWFLLPIIVKQIFNAYTYIQKIDITSFMTGIGRSEGFSRETLVMLNSFISKFTNTILSNFSNTLLNLPGLLLQSVVVLFVFFFATRDSDKLREYVKGLSPFSQTLEQTLSRQFKEITKAVIYGFILIGVLQGVLTGIGLFIFQAPQPLLLSILAIFGAIIPVLGAWVVWFPVSIYLLLSGHLITGIGLLIYGAVLVSWVDNILRPYMVARKTNLSSAIVLIGMIGGLIIFGILGLILGPLILSYLLIIFDVLKEKKLDHLFT